MTQPAPPAWLERILILCLSPRDRETISGDLLEEYREEQLPRLGPARANIWYLRQSISFLPDRTVGGPPMKAAPIAISVFTLLAALWLLSMELILKHPGFSQRIALDAAIVLQSLATIALFAVNGRAVFRIFVLAGSIGLGLAGISALHRTLDSSHFEGYALIISLAMIAQSALTLLALIRRWHAAALALCLVFTASAADYSGKWTGSSPGKKPLPAVVAVLHQDGATLTGTAGPSDTHQLPIVTGRVDGNHVTFDVKMGGGTIRFDLIGDAAALKGTIKIFEDDGRTDQGEIALKRPE